MKRVSKLVLTGSLLVLSKAIFAAPVTFNNSTDFLSAVGGATVFSQDFNAYSHGSNLAGVSVLPGVTVSSNMPSITAWDPLATGNVKLFAYGGTVRADGNAYYDINFGGSYNAFAFDIESYNPAAPGNGVLEVTTVGGSFSYDIFQTGSLESDPIFFGIITNTDIVKARWNEGPEIGGKGNEETGLNNLMVASVVPVPAALPLLLSGLFGLGMVMRRKK